MIGNPTNYNKKYIKDSPLWENPTLDNDIKKYLKLLNGKKILDLGRGKTTLRFQNMVIHI